MFGHVLRMQEETPAQKALEYAVVGANRYKARQGRHCINLFGILRADLKKANLGTLRSAKKLKELRTIASDKNKWLRMRRD